MEDYHKEYVQKLFKLMYDNGYLFEQEEKQDYCENCEIFLSDREIVGTCPNCGGTSTGDQCEVCGLSLDSSEVLDKHCKRCNQKTILKDNKHLYFKLPEFKRKSYQKI